MELSRLNETIWNEKYRPTRVEDCIFPEAIKQNFIDFVQNNEFPNLMLHSVTGGSGKTTVLKALMNELNFEFLFIDASFNRSIDVLREDVNEFTTLASMEGRRKAVLFDECDQMKSDVQHALRAFIERNTKTRFLFTCNYIEKIIPQLQSRCTVISFDWPKSEERLLKNNIFKRIKFILDNENIPFNKDVVIELINKYYPDFRRMINELQRYSISGNIDEGLLAVSSELDLDVVFSILKNKKYVDLLKWVELNEHMNYELFYRKFYLESRTILDINILPTIILILGSYIVKHSQVFDKSINLLCFLTEVMKIARFN